MKKTFFKKNALLIKKDQTPKVGLLLSIAILVLVVLGMIAVFANTHREQIFLNLNARLLSYYHFFINIIAAIVAVMNIVEFASIRKGKLAKLDNWLHVCNFIVVSGLIFNFLFTLVYLIPLSATLPQYDVEYLYAGSNMIFNLFVPVLGAILYIFCFKGYSLKNKWHSLIGLIPTFGYFTVYLILSTTHLVNSTTTYQFDMYLFGSRLWYLVIIAYVLILVCAGAISIGTWKLNKIGKLDRWMFIAVINIFIVIAMIPTSVWMFYYNINHDSVQEGLTKLQSGFMRFLYFTHLSNWWLGATSIIYSIYAIKIYHGKTHQIPIWAEIMRIAGIAAVSITVVMQFVVSASYMIGYKDFQSWQDMLTKAYIKCFQKYLMFEHFLIPVVAIVSFILLEHTQLKWKHLLWAAAPLAFYVLVYAIVVYAHLGQPLRKGPKGSPTEHYVTPWDIYDITDITPQAGKYFYWALPFVTYGGMLILNWVFWIINRNIHFNLPKKNSVWAELRSDIAKYKAKNR